MTDGFVIAGGGLVALRAVEALRRQGYDGPLRIIAAEDHLPYDRPPLSKGVLSGEQDASSVVLRPAEWYAEHDVDLLLGVSAASLRVDERTVALSDGSALRYDRLLIATGSCPRQVPLLAGYDNVHELRTLADSQRLADELRPGRRLAIIGAGFIGLEVAATARKLGVDVTLIEAVETPLAGAIGEQMGQWFAELHRSEGVEVLTGRSVASVSGGDSIESLTLTDGTVIEPDAVVVGIGVRPDTDWLADTPLDNSGVHVDAHGRTAVAEVFAAGDAAATYDEVRGRHVAGSHWEAAARQATRAAKAMLGVDPGKVEPASFWTDQYGIRIQYLGRAHLADAVDVDGEPGERNFVATYTAAGRLVAALVVDRPRALPTIRKQLTQDGEMTR